MKKILYLTVFLVLLPTAVSAQFLFRDATDDAKIYQQSGGTQNIGPGVVVIDFDNDGWDDIYMAGGLNYDKLYRNNHDGTFTNVADSLFATHNDFRSHTRGGTAFDFNNDGLTDIYATTQNTDILWQNNGDGTFTNVSSTSGMASTLDQNESNGATFGDFNGDGYNDLFVARWVNEFYYNPVHPDSLIGYAFKGFPDWLYVNNGNGTFTERAKEFGVDGDTGCGNIGLFFDYDRDGDLDLFVGNDYGIEILSNRVYKNMLMETGHATFVRVDSEIGMEQKLFSMGIGPNDYDRDGDFDFYETNIGKQRLMQNNNNIFTDVGVQANIPDGIVGGNPKIETVTWTPLFADFDNDGWEDGFILHGHIQQILPGKLLTLDTSRFLRNLGNGTFEDVTPTSGIMYDRRGRGAALLDYDHDGKVDIVAGASGAADPLVGPTPDFKLFHNITPDANSGHWLQLKFTARRTAAEGIGTIADVWAGGAVRSRQISTGGGMGSIGSLTAYVGMGTYTKADSINVFWPADSARNRQIDHYYNISADHLYYIMENTEPKPNPKLISLTPLHTNGFVRTNKSASSARVYPNPANDFLKIQNLQPEVQKHFEIFDLLGIKHTDITGTENAFTVSISNLKPGCYNLRITSEGKSITKQFIKE